MTVLHGFIESLLKKIRGSTPLMNELAIKEVFMAYLRYYHKYCLERLMEITKNPSHHSWPSSQEETQESS
jgi:hypothetical protein